MALIDKTSKFLVRVLYNLLFEFKIWKLCFLPSKYKTEDIEHILSIEVNWYKEQTKQIQTFWSDVRSLRLVTEIIAALICFFCYEWYNSGRRLYDKKCLKKGLRLLKFIYSHDELSTWIYKSYNHCMQSSPRREKKSLRWFKFIYLHDELINQVGV